MTYKERDYRRMKSTLELIQSKKWKDEEEMGDGDMMYAATECLANLYYKQPKHRIRKFFHNLKCNCARRGYDGQITISVGINGSDANHADEQLQEIEEDIKAHLSDYLSNFPSNVFSKII